MKDEIDLLVTGAAEVVTLCAGAEAPDPRFTRGDTPPACGRDMDDAGVLPDGAVAVRDGLIVAVGPAADLARRYSPRRTLSAEGGTVLPGFCDPHTHPVFDGTRETEFDQRARGRTYSEITAAGGGIFSSVAALRAAPRERLRARLAERLDRFVICGTTSIEAKSGYGLSAEHEQLSLELLAEAATSHPVDIDATCLAAHQVPPEWRDDRPGYIALVTDTILPAVARAGLARSADVFCDVGAFTPDEARVVLQGARRAGLDLRVHADEIGPVGAAELAGELHARTADHLCHVSEAGLAALHAGGTMPVLLPGTSFSLRLPRSAPARRMIDAGLPVALATDFNPGTSHIPSQIQIVALACGLLGLTVAEALCAATRNAAATLGLPGRRGLLVPGALADLVLLDVPNHLWLGYQSGWNPVRVVIKQGRVIHERPAAQVARRG